MQKNEIQAGPVLRKKVKEQYGISKYWAISLDGSVLAIKTWSVRFCFCHWRIPFLLTIMPIVGGLRHVGHIVSVCRISRRSWLCSNARQMLGKFSRQWHPCYPTRKKCNLYMILLVVNKKFQRFDSSKKRAKFCVRASVFIYESMCVWQDMHFSALNISQVSIMRS